MPFEQLRTHTQRLYASPTRVSTHVPSSWPRPPSLHGATASRRPTLLRRACLEVHQALPRRHRPARCLRQLEAASSDTVSVKPKIDGQFDQRPNQRAAVRDLRAGVGEGRVPRRPQEGVRHARGPVRRNAGGRRAVDRRDHPGVVHLAGNTNRVPPMRFLRRPRCKPWRSPRTCRPR